ncbi:MAG: VOC family protein [Treponema sp.]|nr:VOC family protein [Treponema sp.]
MGIVKRFGHINLAVKNLDKSIEFYCDKLGLKLAFQIHNEEGKLMVTYLMLPDGNFVELIQMGPAQQEKPDAKAITAGHMCFEVDNMEETLAYFKEKGIEIVGGPRVGRDLNHQCFIADPDGNRIEMMQLSPESPQRKSQREVKK